MPLPAYIRRAVAVGLFAALAAAGPADAASPRIAFDIPRAPLRAALLDLAKQAGVSLSLSRAETCAPNSGGLVGRYTLDEALSRLLAGSGCGFRMVDPVAVEIVPIAAKPPPRAEPPRATAPDQTLSEIVVVATRRPTPADRLAYPVSAVESDRLRAEGIADAGDLALAVPAMTVTNLGAGRDKILLRGLSDGPLTGRTQSMVGIYLDDVRLTYNAPDPDLRLVDMARVEVLRGPQGALYGSGSLGGVVHIVTQAPDPSAFAGRVAAGASVTEGGAPSSLLEGVLNLPAPWAGGAVRLVAYRESQGGYIDDPALGLSNVNRSVRAGFRLNAIQRLGPDWSVTAGVVGQSINADDTQYAIGGLGPYERRNRLREPHDNDFSEIHLGFDGDLGWAQAHGTAAALRHRVVSRYDATTAPPIPSPPGPIAFDDDDSISGLVTEGTLASRDDAPVQWLAGAFFASTRQSVSLALTPQPGGAVTFGEVRRDRLDETALFGEAILPLGRGFALTVGGRAFGARTQVDSLVSAPPAPGTAFSGRRSHAGLAPKVVLSYRASPALLAYVQATEGYRSGGFNTSGAPGQAFSGPSGPEPDRRYQGDELWSFEAGVRLRLLDGRLVARAAAFDAVWKNIQSDELLPSGLPFTANIGDGVSRGLEFESTYRAGALVLDTAFLINNPELDRANPAFPIRPELGLAGVPDASASAAARYSWDLAGGRTLSLDGRVAYIGRSHLTFDAQTSPRMGGYVNGRIAAALSDARWRLTAALDNPANVRGDTFAYGNPFTLRTQRQVTPLRPRTLSITVERDF